MAALDEPPGRAQGYASMLDRLIYEMRVGDVVVTPDGANGEVIVGEIAGAYEHLARPIAPDFRHARRVRWTRRVAWRDLPVRARRSMGAPMAVYRPAAQADVLKAVVPRPRVV
jgi:predicted Mrr-cat superfamily restriction endonuclease